MSQSPQSSSLLPRQTRRKRKVPVILLVVLFAVLAGGGSMGVAGVALSHLLAPSSLLDPLPVPAKLPTTPPGFGLKGPATCRTSTPPTNSRWLAVAVQAAQQEHLDVNVFTWQIWQESRFMPDAVSSAGAIGIAQFLPSTADELGIDPHDPAQALKAAAHLDAQRMRQYAERASQFADHYGGSSARYAYGLTLAAYNAGAGAVEGAWKHSLTFHGIILWPSGAWDWLSNLGKETRHYIPAILGCL